MPHKIPAKGGKKDNKRGDKVTPEAETARKDASHLPGHSLTEAAISGVASLTPGKGKGSLDTCSDGVTASESVKESAATAAAAAPAVVSQQGRSQKKRAGRVLELPGKEGGAKLGSKGAGGKADDAQVSCECLQYFLGIKYFVMLIFFITNGSLMLKSYTPALSAPS